MKDLIIRFIIGGFVVSLFSVLSDLFKPKTFAGLFGGAPSVALASLVLTALKETKATAAIEARSMILGAIALLIYASVLSYLLLRFKTFGALDFAPSTSFMDSCSRGPVVTDIGLTNACFCKYVGIKASQVVRVWDPIRARRTGHRRRGFDCKTYQSQLWRIVPCISRDSGGHQYACGNA